MSNPRDCTGHRQPVFMSSVILPIRSRGLIDCRLLGTLFAVLMVFRVGCSLFDRRVALILGLMMATMLLVAIQVSSQHHALSGITSRGF